MDCEYEGNIRELQGMVERAVIICEDTMIKLSDLNGGRAGQTKAAGNDPALADALTEDLPSLQNLENRYIRSVYEKCGKSPAKTCDILKIDRSTLWRKLKKAAAQM